MEFLEQVPGMSPAALYEHFVEGGSAEYYTWYMRLLTAGATPPAQVISATLKNCSIAPNISSPGAQFHFIHFLLRH